MTTTIVTITGSTHGVMHYDDVVTEHGIMGVVCIVKQTRLTDTYL